MSGTVAIDTVRVEEREREASAVTAEPGSIGQSLLRDSRTADHGTKPPPPWPRRRLNDALADLGPMRPAGQLAREPWSRARMSRSDESSAASHANDDGVALPEWPGASSKAGTLSAGNGSGPNLADLPAPTRPSRQADVHAAGAFTSDPTVASWGEYALAEDDAAGADIVRALAEANLAVGAIVARPPVEVTPLDGDEPLERPPMIIERAIAEQGQGLAARQPAHSRGSPLPGLAVGFTLSLMAGAALYLTLASS